MWVLLNEFLWFFSEPHDTLMNRKPAKKSTPSEGSIFLFISGSKGEGEKKGRYRRESSRLALHRIYSD